MTILFADIVGFTALSEKMGPEDVVRRLNEYFSEMVKIIFEFDGTINKFIGDGIMACWGAPIEQPDHAVLAVKCSMRMVEKLGELQR